MKLFPLLAAACIPCLHAAPLLIDSGAETPHDSWGFNAEIGGSICGIQTFDDTDPGLLPPGSPERRWADDALKSVREKVASVHARGLQCFVNTDLFVLPKAVVAKYRNEICDERGRLDIHRPKMREIFRQSLRETLEKDRAIGRPGRLPVQRRREPGPRRGLDDGRRLDRAIGPLTNS